MEDREVEANEDLIFVGETFAKASRIICMDDYLIMHRYHNKSLDALRRDDTPFLALKRLEEKLKEANVYEKVRQSFINLALAHLFWQTSKRINNKKVYDSMRRVWMKHFEFKKYPQSYFYNIERYKTCMKYLKYTYAQYKAIEALKRLCIFDKNDTHIKITLFGIKINISRKGKDKR